jgi:hypothetical protein
MWALVLPASCCKLQPSRFFGGKMTRTDRLKEFGWRCQVCQKSLTAKPLTGKVINHANSSGGLCAGSGKRAVNPASRQTSKKRQAARGQVAAPSKTSKTTPRSPIQQPAVAKRERPEMLPAKKPTGVYSVPKSRMNGEDFWLLFQDNPRQDMETDAGWRRVRLGTSQGTGKRR